MILQSKGQRMAFRVGQQIGLRTSSEAIDQLIEQLHQARADLQQVRTERAEYLERIAAAKEHFNAEASAMRKELAEALAELDQLRIQMFSKWQRSSADTVN